MSAEITNFPVKPEEPVKEDPYKGVRFILVCKNCGAKSFFVQEKDGPECTACGQEVADTDLDTWRKFLPQVTPAAFDKPEGNENVTVTIFPDETFAQRAVLKEVTQYQKDGKLVLLVGYNSGGWGRCWTDVRTVEQRDWVNSKLEEIRDFLLKADLSHENAFTTTGEGTRKAENDDEDDDPDGDLPLAG